MCRCCVEIIEVTFGHFIDLEVLRFITLPVIMYDIVFMRLGKSNVIRSMLFCARTGQNVLEYFFF